MFGLSVDGDPYWDQAKAMFDYGFRTDPAISVGRLVEPSAASGPSSTPAPTQTENRAVATGSDQASSTSVQILIGLVAALAAVILLLIGLKLSGRR
ncbi:hypothetical protein WDY80_07760 [Gordonia hongkongensis]